MKKVINFVGSNAKVIIKYYNIEKYNKKMLRRKEMYRRKKAKYGK